MKNNYVTHYVFHDFCVLKRTADGVRRSQTETQMSVHEKSLDLNSCLFTVEQFIKLKQINKGVLHTQQHIQMLLQAFVLTE